MLAKYKETRSKNNPSKLLSNNSSKLVVKKDFLIKEEANLIEQAIVRIAVKRIRNIFSITIK
jgi:hypothetical protein